MRLKSLWALLLLGLFMALPLQADPKPRVFIGTLEYVGPTLVVDGQVYVDAARFARDVGWSVQQTGSGLEVAASPSQLGGASVLTINGQPFTGASQVDNGQLYVSLADLTSMLHGTVKTLPEYHTIKADIPGMPTAAALAPKVEHRMVSIDLTSNYQLVEFYADW